MSLYLPGPVTQQPCRVHLNPGVRAAVPPQSPPVCWGVPDTNCYTCTMLSPCNEPEASGRCWIHCKCAINVALGKVFWADCKCVNQLCRLLMADLKLPGSVRPVVCECAVRITGGLALKTSQPNPAVMGRVTFHWSRLPRVPSGLALNISRDGSRSTSVKDVHLPHCKKFNFLLLIQTSPL